MSAFKGGNNNMQNLMRQAQKMQEEMEKTAQLLDDWEVVGLFFVVFPYRFAEELDCQRCPQAGLAVLVILRCHPPGARLLLCNCLPEPPLPLHLQGYLFQRAQLQLQRPPEQSPSSRGLSVP